MNILTVTGGAHVERSISYSIVECRSDLHILPTAASLSHVESKLGKTYLKSGWRSCASGANSAAPSYCLGVVERLDQGIIFCIMYSSASKL